MSNVWEATRKMTFERYHTHIDSWTKLVSGENPLSNYITNLWLKAIKDALKELEK
jgi:hypothetical protein